MRKRALLASLLLIASLVSLYFALEAYANVKLKEKIDRRLRKLPYAVSYSYFHYNLALNDLEFKDFSLRGKLFYVKVSDLKVDLPFNFRKKGFPPYLRVSLEGAVVGLNLPLLDELLGESSFSFDLNGWYTFNGDRFSTYLFLKIKKVADVYTETSVENLSYSAVERFLEGRTTVNSLINRGKLDRFLFVFRNRGIYERFLSYAAKQEGTTPGKVREELLKMVERNFKDPYLYANLGKALEEFIEKPNCLKLEVNPPVPVSLREVKKLFVSRPDLKRVVEELGVRLTVCR